MRRTCVLAAAAVLAGPAIANDSVAELGTGGIVLARSDAIAMESEKLFISASEVRVDYRFANTSDADVETIVAFPMPDIDGSPWQIPAMPDDTRDNFLDFEVSIDGKAVQPSLDQRAVALGIDVTDELVAQGIPLFPFGDAATEALARLPDTVANDWISRGIVVIDEYDDGSGWKRVRTPFWKLRSAYWWKATFPAGRPVAVSHRYRPSVGSTVGLTFFNEGKFGGDGYADYKHKYCMDESFERAIVKAAKEAADGIPPFYETRLSYVLTSGGNWANGTIGRFDLTIDKGEPGNLVSFCASGVRKTGPTTFNMTAEDFYPERDIDVLILQRNAPGGAQ